MKYWKDISWGKRVMVLLYLAAVSIFISNCYMGKTDENFNAALICLTVILFA